MATSRAHLDRTKQLPRPLTSRSNRAAGEAAGSRFAQVVAQLVLGRQNELELAPLRSPQNRSETTEKWREDTTMAAATSRRRRTQNNFYHKAKHEQFQVVQEQRVDCKEEPRRESATMNLHIINAFKRKQLKTNNSNKRQVARECRQVIARQLVAISALAFTLTLLMPHATNCDVLCPRNLLPIYPCTCRNGTEGLLIKCTQSNLAILSRSLRAIRDPIEQLEIENSSVTKVFGPLFSDSDSYSFHSTIRELDIRASRTKVVNASSFSQQLLANIQYLMLDRNQLQQVPSELVNNMTNMRMLNLSTNLISAIETNSFLKLTNLTELDLSANKISRLSKSSFSSLLSLEYLNLNSNELTGKLEKNLFNSNRKLRHLDLSGNKLTSLDRQDFSELTGLETLKLANNQLTTLPRSIFSRNAKLYNLDLSFNKLDDIDTYLFKSTRFLKDLDISGNLIKEITKNTFSPTTRIKRINLAQNQLQALGPETFKGLEWLERVDLSHNQIVNISNDAFSRIFQVEIDLSFNKLTRIFYWAFHEVSNMTRLNLSHNLINDGISLIAFESTDCANLDLSYNQIQDISKIPISNLTGIRVLDISHNQITELNKKSFTQKVPLYELHTIDASHNNISSITGNVLERLRSIRALNISHNTLRRLTSGAFGNSPTLLELDLSYNNLVEIVSGTLVGLVSMRNLDLSYNRLKKMIPIPVALNSIHLEHNEISQLNKLAFPSLNSLLELYLDHNRIANIEDGTLSTLLAVHTLSLSYNSIVSVPAVALKDLTSLQNLNLDGNNIQRLGRRAFGTLPIVFNLKLDHNNISSVADHAFDGLLQLLNLTLSHNNIVELPPAAFSGLVSLQRLDLSNNQLNRFENKTRSAMEDLLSLEEANFSNNKLSIITARTFLNSPYIPYRLTKLDLSNNLIGILVNHFAYGLRKVEWLSLRNNIINEILPNVLGNMTRIKYLDLSHNKMRTLKEGTFEGQFLNLTTLLLNNNKLVSLQAAEFDKMRRLELLDLSSNRLESVFAESERWIRRGVTLDLRQNNLVCTCDQLTLIAWLESFKSRNSTYTLMIEQQQQQQLQQMPPFDRLTRNQLTPKLLHRYASTVQIMSEVNCAKPEMINGKSIMQILDLATPSFGSSSSEAFNCDKERLDEVDSLRRLRAPIQFQGAEPYSLDGQQQLRIGWTLLDPQLDLLNFVVLRARFEQKFDMSLFRSPTVSSSSPSLSSSPPVSQQQPMQSSRHKILNDLSTIIQLSEHELEQVPYNERTLVLRNLNPRYFYVVCITYETSERSTPTAPTSLIDLLAKSASGAANNSTTAALFATILVDYERVNCISLQSLLQQDNPERLISGAFKLSAQLNLYTLAVCQLVSCLAGVFSFCRPLYRPT